LLLVLLLSAGWSAAASRLAGAEAVRLLLVISVDQMRPDYFNRFGDQFTGGLKQLAQKGLFFSDAHQDHACTVTAVGHTLLTGLHPARTGIVGNDWYDRKKKKLVYCTDDPDEGVSGQALSDPSPKRLRATTLSDWLRNSSPSSKVYSISRKDRSAILMAGKNPSGVLWFDSSSGDFVTSSYYKRGLPDWVKEFNSRRPADSYFGKAWERVLPDASAYTRSTADDHEGEGQLPARTLPHVFSGSSKPDPRFYSFFSNTPFVDELTLRLAQQAVRSEELGMRDALDILTISLSSTDAVGHRFGPDSQEMQDMILRVDRYLGDFFQFLESTVGMGKVLIVLSADHGVQPLPEVQNARGIRARRVIGELGQLLRELENNLQSRFGPGPWIEQVVNDSLYLDYDRIKKRGLLQAHVENVAARVLRRSPLIQDVFTRTELLSGSPHKTPFTHLFVNAFNPENSGDVFLQFKINHLVIATPDGSDHGSPYPYDSNVPLIFAGPGISPGKISSRVRTVDLAPTLADILGIPAPAGLDGRVLRLTIVD
jgi:predicted AlkP superfamily pyrophosphatase or phosphodiesterase